MRNYVMLYKLAEEVEEKPFDKKGENPFAKKDEKAPKGEEEGAKSEEQDEPQEQVEEQQAASGTVDPVVVMDFLASSGTIDDAAFHAFAEENGFNVHEAEAIAYNLAQRFVAFLRGGKSAGMDIGSVDPQQLEMGMQIEKEHTDCPCLQKKISLDHLSENPEYYSQDVFQKELQKEQGAPQSGDNSVE